MLVNFAAVPWSRNVCRRSYIALYRRVASSLECQLPVFNMTVTVETYNLGGINIRRRSCRRRVCLHQGISNGVVGIELPPRVLE